MTPRNPFFFCVQTMMWFCAALAFGALTGCALPQLQARQDQAHRDHVRIDTVVGKVEGVYEQEYDGVYVLRTGMRPRVSQTLFAHVFFTVPLDDGRTSTMIRINAKQGIQRGDLVAFQIAQVIDETSQNSPAKSQVSAIVAKHDTPYAANYGRKPVPAGSTQTVTAPAKVTLPGNGLVQASSRSIFLH